MKALSLLLVGMIAIHSLCGAQCLGSALQGDAEALSSASAEPSCHGTEEGSHESHSDEVKTRFCGETSSIELKNKISSKWFVPAIVAEVTENSFSLDYVRASFLASTGIPALTSISPQSSTLVLRI